MWSIASLRETTESKLVRHSKWSTRLLYFHTEVFLNIDIRYLKFELYSTKKLSTKSNSYLGPLGFFRKVRSQSFFGDLNFYFF